MGERGADGGGIHAWLTGYLARRSPAALLVDAGLVLVLSFVASHLWTALADATPYEVRSGPAQSVLAAIGRPATLMRTISSLLFSISWFLAAWSVARLLAPVLGRDRAGEGPG